MNVLSHTEAIFYAQFTKLFHNTEAEMKILIDNKKT